jgi:DNA-binding CsgD family transcriptional regulator
MDLRHDDREDSNYVGDEIEDESTLLSLVHSSTRSVAVYDVARPAILAASQLAREQLGFVDVELTSVNIVDSARDPESVRQLLALIREGQLKAWSVRTWLRDSSGGGSWAYATGHTVDINSRRFGLVSYPSSIAGHSNGAAQHQSADASALDGDAIPREAEILEQHGLAGPRSCAASGERPESDSDRVIRLEAHLSVIAREVQAAGLSSMNSHGPATLGRLGLEGLSARERDIATRIMRGDRVPTIARSLFISASTVRNHLSRIYRKAGVHSQIELLELLQNSADRAPSGNAAGDVSRSEFPSST